MTYTTPSTSDVPLRVVAFERAPDGSPGYEIFHARKVSVSPKSTLYQLVDGEGRDLDGLRFVDAGDVLSEEPIQ